MNVLTGLNTVKFWPGPAQEVDLAAAVPVPEGWSITSGGAPGPTLDVSMLVEIVERVAPWLDAAYLVPKLTSDRPWGGMHSAALKSIYVTYNARSQAVMLETLYHELFHAVQRRLSDDLKQRIEDHTYACARRYDDEKYLDTPLEQCARLFETFAMYLENGGVVITSRYESSWLPSFLTHVYSGGFAREVLELDRREAAAAVKAERRAAMWSRAKTFLPNFLREGI